MNIYDEAENKHERIVFLNTNARSLCPKFESMLDNFNELECCFGVVTETWMRDGKQLEDQLQDVQDGHGLSVIYKNRKANTRGISHGGVCIITRDSRVRATKLRFHNAADFEVIGAVCKVTGRKRKFVVIACYMPPSMNREKSDECLKFISDMVHEAKRSFDSPHIVVAGDFNQFDVVETLKEHQDLDECTVGPTKGNRLIDRTITNLKKHITYKGTIAALQPDSAVAGADSDHLVTFFKAAVPGSSPNQWISHSFRPYTKQGEDKFRDWVVGNDWTSVLLADSSNAKANTYQKEVESAMDRFFPMRTVKRKANEEPWINDTIRRKDKAKKNLFKKYGRTEKWKELEEEVRELKRTRKEAYLEEQKERLTGGDAIKQFHKTVRNYKSAERPTTFDVKEIYPGMSSEEAAEELSLYFNRISSEFVPLDAQDIPTTRSIPIPPLELYQVAARLRSIRKPKSLVNTDIFPNLVTLFADQLAVPLGDIYNEVLRSGIWPAVWKREFVTAIPKKTVPETPNDLRNISCTALVSKVF